MEESTPATSTYTVTSKKRVLLALVVIQLLDPLVLWLASSSSAAYGLVYIFLAVAYVAACIIWVSIDANEKGITVGHGFRIFMVLLMPAALTYYFYRSRGFKQGSWALLKAIGFFLGLVILGTIVSILLSLIDGTFWTLYAQ